MKRSLMALAVLALASSAQAGVHNMGGCGLGSMIFKNNVKGEQILAATTNGLFGNQTFGISSETLGCTKDGVVKSEKRREVFASVNLQKLSQEMAQGRGEFLNGFAALSGCKDQASRDAFAKFAQQNYQKIFTSEDTDATALLKNVDSAVAADPALSQACAS
ncbi:MAG: DUF3015 domain-containing protein [Elusimicrobia bacterium]|nr:DUF3015 domain-containing protein [Elusimicrobiota bacterium]